MIIFEFCYSFNCFFNQPLFLSNIKSFYTEEINSLLHQKLFSFKCEYESIVDNLFFSE